MPHKAFNLSDTEGATALSARNDPNEQENVVLTPELDDGRLDAACKARRRQLSRRLRSDRE